MARIEDDRGAHLRLREHNAEMKWKSLLAARMQHERKVAAREEKHHIRRSILMGQRLLADPSPEARVLLDAYVARLTHAQDMKLFGLEPALQVTETEASSEAEVNAPAGNADAEAHAEREEIEVDGKISDLTFASPSAPIALLEGEWVDCEALASIQIGDGSEADSDKPVVVEISDASAPAYTVIAVPVTMDHVARVGADEGAPVEDILVEEIYDEPSYSDMPVARRHPTSHQIFDELEQAYGSPYPSMENGTTRVLDLLVEDAETAEPPAARMTDGEAELGAEILADSQDDSAGTDAAFVARIYNTPQNTRSFVEALGLKIRRQPLNDGTPRWGAFAATPEQADALEKLGLDLIGPAIDSVASATSAPDRPTRAGASAAVVRTSTWTSTISNR